MRGRVRVGGDRGLTGEVSGTCSSARLSHGWEWTDVTEPARTEAKCFNQIKNTTNIQTLGANTCTFAENSCISMHTQKNKHTYFLFSFWSNLKSLSI